MWSISFGFLQYLTEIDGKWEIDKDKEIVSNGNTRKNIKKEKRHSKIDSETEKNREVEVRKKFVRYNESE